MPRADGKGLTIGRALVLGALHGPAEMLPVSSSAHLTLVPALAGWGDYLALDGATRKALEVGLHGGTAVGIMLALPAARPRAERFVFLACSSAPAALAGLLGERWIERRLGGVGATAAGLIAGAVVLAVADVIAQRRGAEWVRDSADTDAVDGLVLGLAQAAALVPGLSRSGLALAAARVRGLDRRGSHAIAREAGLPVLLGAAALRSARLARSGLAPELRAPFAAGAAAACASALLAAPGLARVEAVLPFAAYRLALGVCVLTRR